MPLARVVLDAGWINVHRSTSRDFIEAFAHYADRLVAGGKNLGECGVLAMGQIYKCEVVIDDAIPRQIAKEKGIRITATVPLLCEAVRAKKLTTVMVEELADNLLESKYYLPFGPGGFRQHVLENGLLDYDELTSFEHDLTRHACGMLHAALHRTDCCAASRQGPRPTARCAPEDRCRGRPAHPPAPSDRMSAHRRDRSR